MPLATFFNTSSSTGIVPSKFKVANVILIHKKGSFPDLCNYRPISLLSAFNKLSKFLEKEKMLFQGQFGFRSNHSTDFAILSITDKVQQAIDQGDLSHGIFLDFSLVTIYRALFVTLCSTPVQGCISIFILSIYICVVFK